MLAEMLKEAHYSPKKIDDGFSKKIFQKYFEDSILKKIFF